MWVINHLLTGMHPKLVQMLNKTLKLFTLGHRNAPGKDTGAVHDLPMIYPGFCRISGSSRSPMTIQARNWRFAIDYIDSPRYFLITTGCWHWEFPNSPETKVVEVPKFNPSTVYFLRDSASTPRGREILSYLQWRESTSTQKIFDLRMVGTGSFEAGPVWAQYLTAMVSHCWVSNLSLIYWLWSHTNWKKSF